MIQPLSLSGFSGCILCPIVQEIDNANFRPANQRYQPRKLVEPKLDIVVQFFQDTILIPAISGVPGATGYNSRRR